MKAPPSALTVILTVALLAALAIAVLAAPCAEAQTGTVPRIGLLEAGSLTERAALWEAFRQGMRELGYVDGQTVAFEVRGGDGTRQRAAVLASELVRLNVDVIVTAGNAAAVPARQATGTIPIVMASGTPLEVGLVKSLARPGGNVTGVTSLSVELSGKRLDLARELVPGASRFATLYDSAVPGAPDPYLLETEAAARSRGVRLRTVVVTDPAQLDAAFATIARDRPAVLLPFPSPMFFGERRRLAELALKHRLPTVHSSREYVDAGGLVGYGANLPERFRRAAVFVDKILKGAKPADLPVEQPTKFELVINLKTAKQLGLTIPPAVLTRADEIIQ